MSAGATASVSAAGAFGRSGWGPGAAGGKEAHRLGSGRGGRWRMERRRRGVGDEAVALRSEALLCKEV